MRTAQILNGREIAEKMLARLAKDLEAIQRSGQKLTLATVQIGESKDTVLYSQSIERTFKKVNAGYLPKIYPEKISQSDLQKEILKLNRDPQVSAILVFSPLPAHIQQAALLSTLDVLKDVERVVPPTAAAAVALIEETGAEIMGKEAVVVGRSNTVGRPATMLLLDKRATVTVCHSKTRNLRGHVENADIVIAAAGQPELIKGEWIKPGAIVIDVGENVVNGKLVGDVEFEKAKERAGFISPVPGGVGPLTHVMLIKNLLTLHKLKETAIGNPRAFQ